MIIRATALTLFLLLVAKVATSYAGDALAIGYNADGVWTSVTYYCSGTPKGGADYKDEAGAREAALRDLKTRAGEDVVTTKILASSDRTGHFAYARGKKKGGADAHALGYGVSKAEAEQNALTELQASGATRDQQVIYHYFSHGSKPQPKAAAKRG